MATAHPPLPPLYRRRIRLAALVLAVLLPLVLIAGYISLGSSGRAS